MHFFVENVPSRLRIVRSMNLEAPRLFLWRWFVLLKKRMVMLEILYLLISLLKTSDFLDLTDLIEWLVRAIIVDLLSVAIGVTKILTKRGWFELDDLKPHSSRTKPPGLMDQTVGVILLLAEDRFT